MNGQSDDDILQQLQAHTCFAALDGDTCACCEDRLTGKAAAEIVKLREANEDVTRPCSQCGGYAAEVVRLTKVLEEIQFNDCCYETRVLVDEALERGPK